MGAEAINLIASYAVSVGAFSVSWRPDFAYGTVIVHSTEALCNSYDTASLFL